jgi:hypothetical protein
LTDEERAKIERLATARCAGARAWHGQPALPPRAYGPNVPATARRRGIAEVAVRQRFERIEQLASARLWTTQVGPTR